MAETRRNAPPSPRRWRSRLVGLALLVVFGLAKVVHAFFPIAPDGASTGTGAVHNLTGNLAFFVLPVAAVLLGSLVARATGRRVVGVLGGASRPRPWASSPVMPWAPSAWPSGSTWCPRRPGWRPAPGRSSPQVGPRRGAGEGTKVPAYLCPPRRTTAYRPGPTSTGWVAAPASNRSWRPRVHSSPDALTTRSPSTRETRKSRVPGGGPVAWPWRTRSPAPPTVPRGRSSR